MDTTFDLVRNILVAMLGVEPERVRMESRIMEDLEATQLDVIQVLLRVESQFNIQIPDGASAHLQTVGDLVSYVDSQIVTA